MLKGSCYRSVDPDRCCSGPGELRFYPHQAPEAARRGGWVGLGGGRVLLSLAYSPRLVRASRHRGNLASVESLRVLSRWQAGAFPKSSAPPHPPRFDRPPPPRCAVSHRGREQPPLLGVRGSSARLLCLRLLREPVVGVGGRLASAPAPRRRRLGRCRGNGARPPGRESVDGARRRRRLLFATAGWNLSFRVGGGAAGRWSLGPGRRAGRWGVTLRVLIMPDFVLYDDRRAKRGGRFNLRRQGGGGGDSHGGGRPRGGGRRSGAAGATEGHR